GLAQRFLAVLHALVAHASAPSVGGYTPSDFRRVTLPRPAVARIAALAARDGESPRGKNVDDVYPLSPMQEGLLFHTLYSARRETYVVSIRWTLAGKLDVPAFRRAWEAVVARHAILRSAVAWEGLPAPIQVVRRAARLPFEEVDLRAISPDEQDAEVAR